MNTDIVNDIEKVLSFLKTIIFQLTKYNSISIDDLKLLCHLVYKQKTIDINKEIEYPLITALGYINQNTKVYSNEKIEITNYEDIFYDYINTNLKEIFGDKND